MSLSLLPHFLHRTDDRRTANVLTRKEISCDPARPYLEQLRLVIVVVELRLHRVNVRLEPQHLQLDPRILPLKLGDLLVQRQDVLGRDARPTVRWYAAQVGCQTVGRSGGRVGCDRNTAAARRPIVRSVLPVAGGRTRSAVIGSGATDYTRDGVTVQAGHGMCETGKQPGRGARWTTARRKNLGAGRGSRRPNQQRTGPGHQAALDALAVAGR